MKRKIAGRMQYQPWFLVGVLFVTILSLLIKPAKAFAATEVECGDFLITGGTYGVDYTYVSEKGGLQILTDTPLTIKNTDPLTATHNFIEIAEDVDADITLAGVNINVKVEKRAALQIAPDSFGNVIIRLADNTENILVSGEDHAGLEKYNGETAEIGTLTIEGDTGILRATGGVYGAGIGSGGIGISGRNCSNITINGGTIVATGGTMAAGIGSGSGASVNNIIINGGNITACSESHGAGIGGGAHSDADNILINGGTIVATGGEAGAGIGGGWDGSGSNIVIKGGDVTARGGWYGAGIGGGGSGSGDNLFILGGNVSAKGNGDVERGDFRPKDIGNGSDVLNHMPAGRTVIFEGNNGVVHGGKVDLNMDLTIGKDTTLTIIQFADLIVSEDVTIINEGTIVIEGKLSNNGTIVNHGVIQNSENIRGDGTIEGDGVLRKSEAPTTGDNYYLWFRALIIFAVLGILSVILILIPEEVISSVFFHMI